MNLSNSQKKYLWELLAATSMAPISTMLPERIRKTLEFRRVAAKELLKRVALGDWNDVVPFLDLHVWRQNIPGILPFVDAKAFINNPPPFDELKLRTGSSLNEAEWHQRLRAIMAQVCVVAGVGTGFLVGPDLVMTNEHVVYDETTIEVHFERKLASGANAQRDVFKVLEVVARSPTSDADYHPEPKQPEATEQELDFVLLRVDGRPGDERGVIKAPGPVLPSQGGTLQILQYPSGHLLCLGIQEKSVAKVNTLETRVTHKTSTDYGSSGSPCFDADWNLVAIHRGSVPDGFNEAVPMATVRKNLDPALRGELQWT